MPTCPSRQTSHNLIKPSNRRTWGFHGKDGWTVGPVLDHYQCIKTYVPATRAEINCNTFAFFPHDVSIPKVSTEDYLRQAASDIINLLTNPVAHLTFLHVGDNTQNTLLKIAQLLNRSVDLWINLSPEKPLKNNTIPTSDKIRSHIPTLLPSETTKNISLQPPRVTYKIPSPKISQPPSVKMTQIP